jgi:hypothetical protein
VDGEGRVVEVHVTAVVCDEVKGSFNTNVEHNSVIAARDIVATGSLTDPWRSWEFAARNLAQ